MQRKLLDATAVFCWFGLSTTHGSQTNATATTLKVTLVSLHYLRPWRPTFTELEPTSANDKAKLIRFAGGGRDHIRTDEPEDYVTCTVQETRAEPLIHTHLDFLHGLDKNKRWTVAIMELSSRCSSFLQSHGRVRILIRTGSPQICFWTGEEKLQPKNQDDNEDDKDDAADAVDADNDNDDPSEVDEPDEKKSEDTAKDCKEEDKIDDTDGDEKNFDYETEVAFGADLLKLWDDLAKVSNPDQASGESDTSSSSGTGSTSPSSSSSKSSTLKKRKTPAEPTGNDADAKSTKPRRGVAFGPHPHCSANQRALRSQATNCLVGLEVTSAALRK